MLLRTSPRPGLQPPVTRGHLHARLAFSPVRERVHCPARGRKAGRALRTQAFLWWPGSRVSAKSISCTIVRGGLPGVCRHFSLHEQFTAQPRLSCSWETRTLLVAIMFNGAESSCFYKICWTTGERDGPEASPGPEEGRAGPEVGWHGSGRSHRCIHMLQQNKSSSQEVFDITWFPEVWSLDPNVVGQWTKNPHCTLLLCRTCATK